VWLVAGRPGVWLVAGRPSVWLVAGRPGVWLVAGGHTVFEGLKGSKCSHGLYSPSTQSPC